MRTSLNSLICFFACVAVTIPAAAQQAGVDERYPYVAAWLFGELGQGCAGVAVSRKYKNGEVDIKDLKNGTTVEAPNGRAWDLSRPEDFMNLLENRFNSMFIIVSPTGNLNDATFGKSPIGGIASISTKIDARQDLFAG